MAAAPHIVVSDVDLDKDWDDLFAAYWKAWSSPPQAAFEVTLPGIGLGGSHEAAAFEQAKQNFLEAARANPDQHWIKAEDLSRADRGLSTIIGGGCWVHYHEKPVFKEDEVEFELPVSAFTPGSELRDLSLQFYTHMYGWHSRVMQSAHGYGQASFMTPEYRSNRAAEAIVRHFLKTVDKFGIEAYCESTEMAKSMLLRCGFIPVVNPTLVFQRENPSSDWVRLVKQLQAETLTLVWRPKGGVYKEGETVLPWKAKSREAKL